MEFNLGMVFSAKDQDNDKWSKSDCSGLVKSGWWHKACTEANLNGRYLHGETNSHAALFWSKWKGHHYSLKFSEMKMKPMNN